MGTQKMGRMHSLCASAQGKGRATFFLLPSLPPSLHAQIPKHENYEHPLLNSILGRGGSFEVGFVGLVAQFFLRGPLSPFFLLPQITCVQARCLKNCGRILPRPSFAH